MAHENAITLNGQSLFTVGPVTGRSVAEFNAGFKIGNATYDDREHAFFLPLDDFTGGIGQRRVDIHQQLGGYWDGGEADRSKGALDTRRVGHITLPPLRTTLAMPSSPGAVGLTGGDWHAVIVSNLGGTDHLYIGVGNKIWRMNTDRVTVAEVATLQAAGPVRVANNVQNIFEWQNSSGGGNISPLTEAGTTATANTVDPSTGKPVNHGLSAGMTVVIGGASDAKYNGTFTVLAVPTATSFTYTTTAGATSPDVSANITWSTVATRRLYALTIGGDLTSRYWYSTDGASWTEGGRTVWEGVIWDGKIVASLPLPAGSRWGSQGTIVCGYTADGINWNVDYATDANISRPKYFFQNLPHWVGVAAAPWGGTTPYFLDNGQLYALDFYKETAQLIQEVGDKTRITAADVFEGYVWCTDGWNVWVYDPGGAQTVKRFGLYDKYGAPPSLRGFTLATFIGGTSTLYGVLVDNLNNFIQLIAFTGQGWVPMGPTYTSNVAVTGIVDRFPIGLSVAQPSRYLDIVTNNAQFGTTVKLTSFLLPTTGDVPIVGDTTFDAGPDQIVTGWYDGGFIDLFGALHRMYIHGFNLSATETVKVEYQLDQNESGAWTTLGTFTTSTGTIWFDATNHRGVKFRTCRFRITMVRGNTTTTTPELIALVLVYDKKPEFRSLWTFRIDVNLMVEEQTLVTNNLTSLTEVGTTVTAVTQYPHYLANGDTLTIVGANDVKYNGVFVVTVVDSVTFTYTTTAGATSPDTSTASTWSAPANIGRVWSFMKTVFDTKTLVPLVIPNAEGAWVPGLNIRIVDMPVSFEDYRDAVRGFGYLEVQALQPVGINQ